MPGINVTAFQLDAFQAGAFQQEVQSEWAFQKCAFQANAFQAEECGDTPVVITWDTAQGIARNLANNLKYQQVHDAEHLLPLLVSSSSVGRITASAGASGEMPYVGCTSSVTSRWGVSGNGYAELERTDAFVTVGAVSWEADAEVTLPCVTCAGMGWDADAFGDAEVILHAVEETTTSVLYISGHGVKNPTDEEMGAMMVNLLAQRRRMQWQTPRYR